MKTNKIFPNGFASWMETHYEVSFRVEKIH